MTVYANLERDLRELQSYLGERAEELGASQASEEVASIGGLVDAILARFGGGSGDLLAEKAAVAERQRANRERGEVPDDEKPSADDRHEGDSTAAAGWKVAGVTDRQRISEDAMAELRRENERLNRLINTPNIDDFLQAVRLEAAHQCERFGVDHDRNKEPEDWFWVLGYLAGKSTAALRQDDSEKALHHLVSSGAVLLNQFLHLKGVRTEFQPGKDGAA